jgi:uncharacterized protein (DUF58 family)
MPWRSWSGFRQIRYRPTRSGVAFTFALLLVAVAAALSANNLLFLIAAAMLATLLISSFVSRLSLAGLQVDLLLPEHISARRPTPACIRLRNLKWLMPSVSIQISGAPVDGQESILRTPIYYPILPGRAVVEEDAEVYFPKRGEHGNNLFVFTTRFPFGFLEKKFNVVLKRETLVYPAIEPRAEWEPLTAAIRGDLETQAPGGEHDFYRIRPYVNSESARHLDWKSTARTGELQVREFAREQRLTLEIVLDRRVATGHEEWFESAIECCAFLVWEFQSSPVVVRSQRYVARIPDDCDVYDILKFLAKVTPDAGPLIESALDEPTIQVLLTNDPERTARDGWRPAHVAPVPRQNHENR